MNINVLVAVEFDVASQNLRATMVVSEADFFAKHLMKNREETTNMNYNLFSNRRNAINITMKLYQSFSCADGTKFDIDKHEVDKLMTNFTSLSKNSRSVDVITWLLQHNPDVSKRS